LFYAHISVDAVNVMAAYQPVVLTCVHCGGRIETHMYVCSCFLWYPQIYPIKLNTVRHRAHNTPSPVRFLSRHSVRDLWENIRGKPTGAD